MSKKASPEKPWTAGKLNKQRKAVRKAMIGILQAYERGKRCNRPIGSFV